MNVLRIALLLSLIALLLGCGDNASATPTTAIIALPTTNVDADGNDATAVPPNDAAETVVEADAADDSDAATSPMTPTRPAVAPAATDSPSDGRLLLIDPANQIVTINPDGSDVRRLTDVADGIVYIFPAWSPDNQSIAAIGAGNQPLTDGVYLFEDSADVPANLIHTADNQQPIYLSWSPDSENISFIAPSSGGSTLLDLHIIQRDGLESSRNLASGQPFYWDWNSTGDEIVINAKRTTHAQFAYVNPNNGEIGADIADVTDFFQSPDLSFDDTLLAYSGGANGVNEIVIEDRATGETVRTEHTGLTAFAWSPVANQLAFISSVGQTPLPYGPLHLFDPTGTEATLVADAIIAFFWSPDGTKVAYLTLNTQGGEPEARRGRLSARSAEPYLQSNRLEYQLWVKDVSTTETHLLGAFRPGNLFITQFLPFFDQYAHSHSIWSPDSSALALPIQTEEGVTIYRFPANGAQPTPIAVGRVAFWTRQ